MGSGATTNSISLKSDIVDPFLSEPALTARHGG